ncbi:MAG: GAF domain-containing protein [Nevskiales bacterium]|nr:GAF domain-containing protein [Nevskiales bacterium]
MKLGLDNIRPCLEGGIPGVLATCSPDGVPNVTLVSQVYRADAEHVALSFQFFNKTRENILANPRATVQLIHPVTAARFRMSLHYERTESAGPLFERMKAQLSGIASHTGMNGIFHLRGADIYRVVSIEALPGPVIDQPACAGTPVPGLRAICQQIVAITDLDHLLEVLLAELERHMDFRHSMVLLADAADRKLYTVATRGFSSSGVGAEIPLGAGVIGVAAEQRTPIRVSHATAEYAYSRAVRDALLAQGQVESLETEIPFPGLPSPRSQLAVPIVAADALLGVLYVESPVDQRFSYDDEDALLVIASLLAVKLPGLSEADDDAADDRGGAEPAATGEDPSAPVTVRCFTHDHSVFIDNDYLIKGVAGAVLWKLLSVYQQDQRVDFSNRELRRDGSLRLPDIVDNLEARLILLKRRLDERCPFIRIEKTGRGRFRLVVTRRLVLDGQG